ncbi:hypothetical protein [uncultured Nocardioides sp.]|uniref:HoxN/HupN/NixA family nickel/cobalt transporter n=1 Tax=uncultured Nocardioides sp. TaxID=198441 RepID=UPI0025D8EB8E|nr:hypothetical protein [uncultured Nocardioides sp.]
MRRTAAVLLGTAVLVLLPAGAASAHPLGNFTVNTADRVVVTSDGVEVTHVVDLAEIPSVALAQPRSGADTDGDGELSEDELDAYAAAECGRVGPELALEVDGAATALRLVGSSGEGTEGAAGLPVTRLECSFTAEGRPRQQVRFDDPVARERNGWREVSAGSLCGPLRGAGVVDDSPSALLTQYPEDLLQSPVDVTSVQFQVDGDASCTTALPGDGPVAADEVAPRGVDRLSRTFTDFLGRKDLTVPFALLSLAAAVVFGVLHALAPGHGKTVMAAYLVGQRGTRRQAVHLGAVVTFTHTASVLLLGLLLSLGALAAPELVVPITEVLSGVLLALVGGYLVVLALRRRRGAHDHGHDHPHDHDHDHHDHPHDDHDHDHGHDHHDHHDHPHSDGVTSPEQHPAGGGTAVVTRPLTHSHGGRAHTHAPLPDGPLSWRSLAAMGVAGGLVPSPSALLVLLSATALGRAWFGVVLVVAYGVGMAVTLTAAGLLLLRARAALDRRGWSLGPGRSLARLLPLGTAGVVVLVGLGLVLRGLVSGRGLL